MLPVLNGDEALVTSRCQKAPKSSTEPALEVYTIVRGRLSVIYVQSKGVCRLREVKGR